MGLATAFAAQATSLQDAKENRRDKYGKILFDGMVQVMLTLIQNQVKAKLQSVGPGERESSFRITSLRKARDEGIETAGTPNKREMGIFTYLEYFNLLGELAEAGTNRKLTDAKAVIYAEGAKLNAVLFDYLGTLKSEHSVYAVASHLDIAVYQKAVAWLHSEGFVVVDAEKSFNSYYLFEQFIECRFKWPQVGAAPTKKRGRPKKTAVSLVNKM